MHSDSFFVSGNSHKVCQDYARSGKINNKAYTIISDGCSSSPDTDFGARFLTLAAIKNIEDKNTTGVLLKYDITALAKKFINEPLNDFCLDATLLIAQQTNENVDVQVSGDGVIAVRKIDKSIDVYTIDFNENAPAYISYVLDAGRSQNYFNSGFGKRLIKLNGSVIEDNLLKIWSSEQAATSFYPFSFDKNNYDLVVICSDGIHTFQNKETLESIPLLDVINHIMDFKTLNGEFLTRRMKKFLNKECKELNWDHYDDLSVGAIYMDD